MPRLALVLTLLGLPLSARAEVWTTSRIEGSPEPPRPYAAEVVWPELTFEKALDIAHLPSREKIFLIQQGGRILALPHDLNAIDPVPEEFADLSSMLPEFNSVFGMAFHPEFEANAEVYLFYRTVNRQAPEEDDGTRISRFLVDQDSLTLRPETEEILLTFRAGGHNGGHLGFGPDGMLYILSGDSEVPSPPDPLNTGQDLTDLLSSVLRIDVDQRDEGLTYAIPEDNPFLDVQDARPEIWAYGFRNPWKLCFHPQTGDLWVGDVGWELWEFLYRVERGSNFGWSILEGPQPIKPLQLSGPSPISPPTVLHPHTEFASITCGYVQESDRLPNLQGSLLYGDFVTGQLWGLWHDGSGIQRQEYLADTRLQIVSFGQAAGGEVVFLDWPTEQHLYRLVPNPRPDQSGNFPRLLSETGLFRSTRQLVPARGVHPFEIKGEMYQDGATAERWIGIPSEEAIGYEGKPRNRMQAFMDIPENTVLTRTITKGEQRVETQILHFQNTLWNGYSYQWNEAGNDAELVPAEGLDAVLKDGSKWRFPSRAECARCHNIGSDYRLAFHPGKLDMNGQLERLLKAGVVDENFVHSAQFQPAADPADDSASLEIRARTWLSANCAHCHRRRGGGSVVMEMNLEATLEQMQIMDVEPAKGGFGVQGARLIAPGSPWKSVIYYRCATEGVGHMPMLGAQTVDQEGLNLLRDWILSTGPADERPIPQAPDTVENALILADAIGNQRLDQAMTRRVIQQAQASSNPAIRGLFVRFEKLQSANPGSTAESEASE